LTPAIDLPTVALSYLIATIAAYSALELGTRVAVAEGRAKQGWLVAGALAMGAGIWSMHFTGMQAYQLPGAVAYDALTTLGSCLVAILASGIAFYLVGRPRLSRPALALGGLAMGTGITAMHYMGMAAMRMQAVVHHDPVLVVASVGVAVGASMASLWFAFELRGEGVTAWSWPKLGSAALMGAAIAGMHYTAMAGARYDLAACPAPTMPELDMSHLNGGALALGSLLVLLVVLIGVSRDQARREHDAVTSLQGDNARIGALVAARTRELASQSALLERLICNAPAAIAHLDPDLVVRTANPEFARLTGLPAERVVGRHVRNVLEGAEAALAPCILDALKAEVRVHGFRLSRPDGHDIHHWDLTCCPLLGPDGLPEGYLLLAMDATERVANERLQREKIEALETSDAVKDQFLAILSHELRTPINAVTGFGSILQDELLGTLSAEQHALLAKMLGAADGLLDMVNDLLEMTFIQAGRVDIEPNLLAFEELASHVVARLTPRAQEKQLQLVSEIHADIPEIFADDLRVEQALGHLLGNAIKFTPPGGSIKLRAYAGGDRLVCEVEDTGDGIVPEALPKLFERFTQLDMSSTRRAGGTGLGLSIAKALIEAHGGTIGVRSQPGQGSVFWFTLPVSGCVVKPLG
jgi:PAS domain S-box-containing protein